MYQKSLAFFVFSVFFPGRFKTRCDLYSAQGCRTLPWIQGTVMFSQIRLKIQKKSLILDYAEYFVETFLNIYSP
jgi:hypothetical protein